MEISNAIIIPRWRHNIQQAVGYTYYRTVGGTAYCRPSVTLITALSWAQHIAGRRLHLLLHCRGHNILQITAPSVSQHIAGRRLHLLPHCRWHNILQITALSVAQQIASRRSHLLPHCWWHNMLQAVGYTLN